MKIKKIKITWSAFALLLGIITSLAFTTVKNAETDNCPITRAWYHHGPDEMCVRIKPVRCNEVDQDLGLCTVKILDTVQQLYGKDYNAACANVILYKCASK